MASIIASTITTIVVYLPLATMKGLSGQMFEQLGFTIVFAMLASLIAAMMLVPLFYTVFKPKEKENLPIDKLLKKFTTWYQKILRKLMKDRRWCGCGSDDRHGSAGRNAGHGADSCSG